MARQAMVLIGDEIFYNLHGKAVLQGIYNQDLLIPTNPSQAPQLIFYFMIETDIAEPFKSLTAEVTLPESESVRNHVFVPPPQLLATMPQAAGRTRFYVRHPLLIVNPTLRPGRIESKVVHESGEIAVTPHWIILTPPAQRISAN
jgi:hypothetical protein